MRFSDKFVCESYERSTFGRAARAPLFRKLLAVDELPRRAEITIAGLGFYELFVNGERITKGTLAPYVSNPDHYVYYDNYDIQNKLTPGENVVAVMLGDGFINGKTNIWSFKDNSFNSSPKLALSLEMETAAEYCEFTADSFKCEKGPILFNDLRAGVHYDARLLPEGWMLPGFDDSDWHTPLAAECPKGEKKLCTAEPIRVYKELRPVKIEKGELHGYTPSEQAVDFLNTFTPFEGPVSRSGGYIYDFGENNSGIFRLKIKGERGQKIDIQCAEQLTDGKVNYSNISFYPDGFSQRDIYYLSGEGEEIYEPMFVYHGFRYIYVNGITEEQATDELLTFLVMSSSLPERGSFKCSSELTNTIYEMGRRSDISNFFYFPTDCPHREKNGWTGDASASAEHMMLTIGAERSFAEWLNNIRAAMTEEGVLPGIVPTGTWGYEWGNGPSWDSVLFNLPYFVYKHRGDTSIIRDNADAMIKYLHYISKRRDDRGIIEFGLGDWVPVGNKAADEYDAALGFTDSVMTYDMCKKAEIMLSAIKRYDELDFVRGLGRELRSAIRREYLDTDTYIVKNKCQTSEAMAIYYGILNEEEIPRAFRVLLDIIKEDGDSFTSGFLGLRVLFHVLSELGESELAYKMITKKDFPSYAYWVEKGETTFLEQFSEYDDYYASSKNHHFLGDVVGWLMSKVGGIQVKDHNSVRISPAFISSLDWCECSHTLPLGEVAVRWERQGDEVTVTVSAPEGVSLEIKDGLTMLRDGVYSTHYGNKS